MAILFVDSNNGAPSSPYGSWATAAGDIVTALADAACVAGSTVFVAHNHSRSYTGDIEYTNLGTPEAPISIKCVNTTTGALATTATELTTATGDSLDTFVGNLIYNGIVFKSGNVAAVALSALAVLKNGEFHFTTNGNDDLTGTAGQAKLTWENVDFYTESLTASTIIFGSGSKFEWHGGSVLRAMESVFTLNNSRGGTITCVGVDFSLVTSYILLLGREVGHGIYNVSLIGCKLPAGVPILDTSSLIVPHTVIVHSCDSGDIQDYFEETYLEGQIQYATNCYRTGSSVEYSAKMVSNANSLNHTRPLRFKLCDVYADANPTITAEMIGTVELQSDECWLEIDHPIADTSESLRGTDDSSRTEYGWSGGSAPGSPANLATSTEAWTEDLGSELKRKISVPLSGGVAGIHTVWVCLAYESATIYVDPDVTVS